MSKDDIESTVRRTFLEANGKASAKDKAADYMKRIIESRKQQEVANASVKGYLTSRLRGTIGNGGPDTTDMVFVALLALKVSGICGFHWGWLLAPYLINAVIPIGGWVAVHLISRIVISITKRKLSGAVGECLQAANGNINQ